MILNLLLLLGSLLRSLRHLSGALLGLLDGFDDTDSNGLSHVPDSETTKRWVLVIRLNTHGFAGHELGNASIARLDEFRCVFDGLACSAINLLDEFGKLASNVGSVAIKDRSVASANLTRVVKNDDLGVERSRLFGRVVLGVGADIATTDIFDGDVLDVKADIVTGCSTIGELLVVHFDGLDFSGNVGGSEVDDHASLDDASLDTTDGYGSDTTDLVDILQGKSQGLVGGANRRLDGIDSIKEGLTLNDASFRLLGPALVPGHVR